MATFHQISSQNLECPICLTLFNQPKLLTCSHTFCKGCLERVSQTQASQQTITCPVCRKGTPVPSGDVSKLQTNERLSSLVDEVKAQSPTCSVCDMDEDSLPVSYCQDCGNFMCKTCEINHFAWKPVSNHEVVPVSEVLSGKVSHRRRRKCKTHPSIDEDCFCTHCRENICSTCGMLEHMQAGHQLEKAAVHEGKVMKNIKELQEWAKLKKTTIENHIDCIETQRNEIATMLRKLNDDIDKTYEEYMQVLSDRKEALKCQVKQWSEKFEKELQTMKEESRQTVSHMNAMEELVTNGMKVPLEKDALFAHDTLCENLKSFLGRGDPDDQSPRSVTERAKKMSFRRYVKVNELCLGGLEGYTWNVKADIELPIKDSMMNCMTRAPDGNMAVGSYKDGIHLYSPDGELRQTVLKDVRVSKIGFLADGRSVVRDENKMSLYSPQWEKLDVTFETMRFDEGGLGGLAVDRVDNIYVGYNIMKFRKIQVFTPQGGKAVREIICHGYSPWQLFSFHATGKLILEDVTVSAVVCLDGNGKKENVLKKDGMFAFPAVCRDDSVIVAWVKHKEDLVSIDRYTRDLEQVCNIITDFKIQKPERLWYYLQEFESGEIAFCTPDRLYIFDAI
ncbi:tripartite motif-containing protein 3-like [Diadema setosum]|uniref:tripartite motif-containing protein 3-like n=1 Tax=Diadema setosum TaxID=31175 RepID=UPI003B3B9BC6